MNTGPEERCSDLSSAAGEPLAATAATTERWILVEVPGPWPRDVSIAGALPERAHDALGRWLSATPRSRVLFLRRPGRAESRPNVFAVRSGEEGGIVRSIDVERHDELADVDLDGGGETVDTQLVLVCAHGSRDQCCSLRGTAVYRALEPGHPADALWISSHQGGHRFAGNVLVLPAGIQLGRVDRDIASSVTARALAGRIDLAHYRGRTYYDARVQAAEHAVRQTTGLDDVDDLRLAGVDGSLVRFHDRDQKVHAATVEEIAGPKVPASCGAPPEPQTVFTARVV
jgi:hypothetical protein